MHAGPPIDSDLVPALERSGLDWTVTPETLERRRARPQLGAADVLEGRDIRFDDLVAPGPLGDIPVAVFSPTEDVSDPRPVVLFLHGGGMFSGNRFNGVAKVLDWVTDLGVVVASVDYRLAPEFPHPGPADDCWAALQWLAREAASLGVDERRIVIVGSSAGGGLAAGVALRARDEGGPGILGQMLLSPMLDDRDDTVSSAQYTHGVPWSRGSNQTAWGLLLGTPRPAEVSAYAAPARAESLADLPTTYIDAGTAEIFRDEDVAYASRLWADGVQAELHVWPGAYHGFDSLAPDHPLSVAARSARLDWLTRTLKETP